MIEKNVLRKEIKKKLQAIPKSLYEHYSYQIAQSLYQDALWKSAHMIGITISNPPEVDTYQIIRKAWDEGKTIVIPKCEPKEKRMEFRILERFNQLESVYFSLFEPIEAKTKRVVPSEIDLLIVPGLAFTKDGYRLGVGGGYYDRFLQLYKGKTLSLAFQEQMVDGLPTESHDLPVEKIITNEGSHFTS
ncbi:5-formyltetrahydrofolate cyclo-ligase [Niallia oryzisoli]|uniref:5-formyltetrahydrofolate cyclo-ligase n=1 Tax=Niallia oryzisoli TaxID=1737571 RepID=A0ABZ2CJL1_9BACI